jgi:fatty-acyl-CoA synthase
MTTLLARIERATQSRRGTVTFLSGAEIERVEWAQLLDDATGGAAILQSRGVGLGTRVGILGPTSRALVTAIEATWLSGATAVVLPLPMRLASIEEFVEQTGRRIRQAGVALVVVDPELVAFLPDSRDGDPPVVTLSDLAPGPGRPAPSTYRRPTDDPDALVILQFTSGSTSDPKGVMLPHRQVVANHDAISAAARLDPDDDVIVSWLPLYHDMGLIGLLGLPMSTGTDLVLGAPQDFLAAPARWMEWMSEFGGTATAGPNFAYALAARSLRRLPELDLSRWRLALNGAEPIDPASVEAFCEAGARHGLDRRAAFCVFGMAEATLAVTFPEPGTGMVVDAVDRRVLETDRYAAPVPDDPAHGNVGGASLRRFPLLGAPLPGLEVRIADPDDGKPMEEREVGEIEIRGTSVTPGYDGRPDATAAAFHDGWLRTGDLGYEVGDELVVCGRIKDMIIVGGRNVFPEDVERAVALVDGVRPGNVVAFGTEGRRGGEALVVVAEARSPKTVGLRDAVARKVRDAVGLRPQDVVLLEPGTLPKTSSGKLQRALSRRRYLSEAL